MIGKENKKSWTWTHTNPDINKTIWITTYWKTGIAPVVSPFDNYEAADICAKYYKKLGYEVCVDMTTVFHKCIDAEEESEGKEMTIYVDDGKTVKIYPVKGKVGKAVMTLLETDEELIWSETDKGYGVTIIDKTESEGKYAR